MPSSEMKPTRRDVLKTAAGAAGAALAQGVCLPLAPGQEGPAPVPRALIPADKGIPDSAIAALYERGKQRVYRGEARKTIGMPCGGIGAGQLYVLGDGTLGHWHIDGLHNFTGYGRDNYRTYRPQRPIEQGFALVVTTPNDDVTTATLDDDGYDAIEFVGEYPVARVRYRAKDKSVPPVDVRLEVFSPFIPLNARESAYPATVLRFTIENRTPDRVGVALGGWLQNMVFRDVPDAITIRHRNVVEENDGLTSVRMGAVERRPIDAAGPPVTRVLADFESGTYDGWTATGEAFGDAPADGTIGDQQPVSGFEGKNLVNSYAEADRPTGRLVSDPFTIDLPYLTFRIGGGAHKHKTCINLLINDNVVRTATGRNDERLEPRVWDLSAFVGREAVLEIVDEHSGGWGHVNVDDLALTNALPKDFVEYRRDALGFGEMALSLLGQGQAAARWPGREAFVASLGSAEQELSRSSEAGFDRPLVSTVTSRFTLEPGASRDVTFLLTWHFPNLHTEYGVMYANWFSDAIDVARRLAANLDRLRRETLLFCDTYYRETTLPWWLVSRLMMPISTLATGTCQWWRNGRFWGWEGVGCCTGTCTHVWNYAHGHARLFPELARSTRSMQDLGAGFDNQSGLVGFRSNRAYAADGQAGTILKCYREHLTSEDDEFLRSHWPRIKMALEYLIRRDANSDGVLEDSQHNTFDINFHGPNTFVGALYLAALRAGQRMAELMNEPATAARYQAIFESGRTWTSQNLFNGEYFEQRIPSDKEYDWQYGSGCLSDQLFGQNWAHVLGLGYVYPPEQVRSALRAVYKYNWAPDIGPANEQHKPERWFARPGEGGLFTCTWPRGGRPDKPVRYRDEVWTGIEYQAAAGMIWEGLVDEALVLVRALDQRYDGTHHNPWNEVECGDHYARALASWGVLTALAGFEYDGPAGRLTISPRVQQDDFACFFIAAEGWGTIAQKRSARIQVNSIDVKWGRLRLAELAVDLPDGVAASGAEVTVTGTREPNPVPRPIPAEFDQEGRRHRVQFREAAIVSAGERLDIRTESANR